MIPGAVRTRGVAATTVLAVLLALATAFFAVRTRWWTPSGPPPGGVFGEDGRPAAEAVVADLARGLMSRQLEGGGFEPGEYTYEIERTAASALATAALARIRDYGRIQVPGLEAALVRGLDHLKKKQLDTGLVGYPEPKDHWSQIDATTAAIHAWAVAGRPEDREALAKAGEALQRAARARLRNGWTRGLAAMTSAEVRARGLDDVLGSDPTTFADVRNLQQAPREGPPQTSDWNVAEVICRVIRGIRTGMVDPLPAAVTGAVLDERAEWNYPSTDCAAWWMHAWLVARSGDSRARPWFEAVRAVLAGEATGPDGTVEGGWYANTVTQTAGAALAMLTGLEAEIVSK